MVFPVIGGDGKPTGYEISNSLRFDPGDNSHLSRTPSSEGNKRTFTLSFWAKIRPDYASDTSTNNFFTARNSGGYTTGIQQINGGYIQAFIYDDTGGEEYKLKLTTNAAYRDSSSWYHIVFAVDTTQGTASNRAKLYVNGSQVTSFSTATYPDQNFDSHINDDVPHYIANKDGTNDDYDGHLAEMYLIDGTQYAASNFGETNDNGVWIPKEAKDDLTFGTNGFFLEFKQTGTSANASGKGADTSGQDNHYDDQNITVAEITTDTPTNNFATLNALDAGRSGDLSYGNLYYNSPTSAREQARSNIGLTQGKWYYECRQNSANGGRSVGVLKENVDMTLDDSLGKDDYGWAYDSDGSSRHNNSSTSSGFDSYTTGDIIGVALDLDNHDIYFYKNGTVQNSGTKAFDLDTGELYFPAFGSNSNGSTDNMTANFGNPPYTISGSFPSESDANGYGNFSYEPPSGYYSICTKNLAEYG